MRLFYALVFLVFSSLPSLAQKVEPNRSLGATYYPQALEQAVESLTAGNIITVSQQVEYWAGRSVLLTPGFEAKAGAIFAAHTDYIGTKIGEGQSDHLLVTTYPNPFVEKTTIVYQLANTALTNVFVTNADGKVVGKLVDNQLQEAGRYEVEWQAGQLPAGAYLCTLEAGKQHISSRVIRK